jgi:hypothetical protein
MSYTTYPFTLTIPLSYDLSSYTVWDGTTLFQGSSNPYTKNVTANIINNPLPNGFVNYAVTNTNFLSGNISYNNKFDISFNVNMNSNSTLSINAVCINTIPIGGRNPSTNVVSNQYTFTTIHTFTDTINNKYSGNILGFYISSANTGITGNNTTFSNSLFDGSSYSISSNNQYAFFQPTPSYTGLTDYSVLYDVSFGPSGSKYTSSSYQVDLFVGNFQIFGNVTVYTPPPPQANVALSTALPISNICFIANTPIETDQGTIAISQLFTDFNNHTIDGKDIKVVTRTIYEDDYLICIHKDTFANNYPSKDVILSKEHKILIPHNKKLHPQIRNFFPMTQFLTANQIFQIFDSIPEIFNKVRKVPYHGDILYNIVLNNRGWVVVNNMICETLDPENIIAKLYLSDFEFEYKSKIIYAMNDSIKRRDSEMLKRIASRLLDNVYMTKTIGNSHKHNNTKLLFETSISNKNTEKSIINFRPLSYKTTTKNENVLYRRKNETHNISYTESKKLEHSPGGKNECNESTTKLEKVTEEAILYDPIQPIPIVRKKRHQFGIYNPFHNY